ncbi:unnamed protein product [Euphydryas editha]|uniref:DUF4371 domain-containing protein n=1 Tax=Euphydryas editha TaxID=104508 RepID=A0AAU9TMA7_EUPED|nr:unnamed protein product [Euphydryas editha]
MSTKKRKLSDEHRVFNVKWELDYFITNNNNKIQCMICMQVLSLAHRFMQPKLADKFESVALSPQTVARRIDDIDEYVAKKICDYIVKCEYYSLCLDESTDQTDIGQLIIVIRCISKDFSITEERLNLVPLHASTKGIDIFQVAVMEYGGSLKYPCIVIDGAKSMTGNVTGLTGLLK